MFFFLLLYLRAQPQLHIKNKKKAAKQKPQNKLYIYMYLYMCIYPTQHNGIAGQTAADIVQCRSAKKILYNKLMQHCPFIIGYYPYSVCKPSRLQLRNITLKFIQHEMFIAWNLRFTLTSLHSLAQLPRQQEIII